MKRMSLSKAAIATSTLACATLLSFGWSERSGVSLSVDTAQARVGHPATPMSGAGVARRQARRGAYGHGYGAGVAGAAALGTAAAVGTAAAIGTAAAGAPYYYGGYGGPRYYGGGPYGAQAYYGGSPYGTGAGPYVQYNSFEDYKKRNGIVCDPGGTVKMDDGQTYLCQ